MNKRLWDGSVPRVSVDNFVKNFAFHAVQHTRVSIHGMKFDRSFLKNQMNSMTYARFFLLYA